MGSLTRTRLVIIGAGFGGIGLGMKLRRAGLTDFVIIEKAGGVGGVWRANRYPGAACDVPSHLYSLSFAPWAEWPERYASQKDILDYLVRCVRDAGLESHLRLNSEVTEAHWGDDNAQWRVLTRGGDVYEAKTLVSATGQLSRPSRAQLPGLETFPGTVFHSAEWPDHLDLRGKRVAVVGTGASAIQIVPAIAPLVEKLYLFQRSAPYVLPKPDTTYSALRRFMLRHVPGMLHLSRFAQYLQHEWRAFAFVSYPGAFKAQRALFLRYLRKSVRDPQLRRRLTPDYRMGCKRILLSNDFYPAVTRQNVEVLTQSIREVRGNALVMGDGTERAADCIILATGFTATKFLAPMSIVGVGNKDLHEVWRDGAEAYLGTTVAGFPDFFILYGPNTNLGHQSIIYMLESQIGYVIACLKKLQGGRRSLVVRKDVQDRFNAQIQERLTKTIWATGCSTWYLTAAGKNTTNWPGYTFEFRRLTRRPNWDDYAG